MKEQDYINVGELVSVRVAADIIRYICPQNSTIISREEYNYVINILDNWQKELYKQIKVKP
jgi:hypothetical protein